MPQIASPRARRTRRVNELVQLGGHGIGGLPGERLMRRLGMLTSDDTILRQIKQHAAQTAKTRIRVLQDCRRYMARGGRR